MTTDRNQPAVKLPLESVDRTPKMPSIDEVISPLLFLTRDGREYGIRFSIEYLAKQFGLTPAQRQQRIPSGRATVFQTRVQWAASYLRKAQLLQATKPGYFRISDRGLAVLAEPPARLNKTFLDKLADSKSQKKHRVKKADTQKRKSTGKRTSQSEKGTVGNKRDLGKVVHKEGSRAALFHQIIEEAGTPLHYSVIYERALARLPQDKHFSKNLAYISLHRSSAFERIGEGIFSLSEWDNVTTNANGDATFIHCPQPLLPRDANTKSFFESIMVAREILKDLPFLTATEFYEQMTKWARQSPGSATDIQTAFDAWYAVGLLERVDYARQANQYVHRTLEIDAPLAEARKMCLDSLCHRVSRLSHLLMALEVIPRATVANLQIGLYGSGQAAFDLSTRLEVLAAFEAVRKEGDEWRLTAIGEAVLDANPPGDFKLQEFEATASTVAEGSTVTDDEVLYFPDLELSNTSPSSQLPEIAPSDKDVQHHMRAALYEAIRILFPIPRSVTELVKLHSWRNPTYVGEVNNKAAAWHGWSANLWYADEEFQAIYIDYVDKVVSPSYQLELFGEMFVSAIRNYSTFIIAHVGGLSPEFASVIADAGYVVRVMGRTVHACLVVETREFMTQSEYHWAAQLARLANFQRLLLRRSSVL